jgi:hypothetical protein
VASGDNVTVSPDSRVAGVDFEDGPVGVAATRTVAMLRENEKLCVYVPVMVTRHLEQKRMTPTTR